MNNQIHKIQHRLARMHNELLDLESDARNFLPTGFINESEDKFIMAGNSINALRAFIEDARTGE